MAGFSGRRRPAKWTAKLHNAKTSPLWKGDWRKAVAGLAVWQVQHPYHGTYWAILNPNEAQPLRKFDILTGATKRAAKETVCERLKPAFRIAIREASAAPAKAQK